MINVLFVCHGNICRSPMADAVMQQMIREEGLDDKITVDSAGTSGYHSGETAHRGTLAVLRQHDIPYHGRSRQLTLTDFDRFDYILAMDSMNLANMGRIMRDTDAEIAMFLSYANTAGLTDVDEVPDPYYDGKFDYVYDLVTTGCRALLDKIRTDHNL